MSGIVIRILVVLAPVVIYLLWLRYRRRRQTALDDADDASLAAAQRELAWGIAFVAVLMISAFGYLAFSSGEEPGSRYIPPHVEDGKVVPGHFEKAVDGAGRERPR